MYRCRSVYPPSAGEEHIFRQEVLRHLTDIEKPMVTFRKFREWLEQETKLSQFASGGECYPCFREYLLTSVFRIRLRSCVSLHHPWNVLYRRPDEPTVPQSPFQHAARSCTSRRHFRVFPLPASYPCSGALAQGVAYDTGLSVLASSLRAVQYPRRH